MTRRTLTIGSLAEQTGLSVHTIRAWENRYRALRPTRTEGGHRLYGGEDVVRLCLLRDLAKQGHRLGALTRLGTDELRALLVPAVEGNESGLALLEHAMRALDVDEALRVATALFARGGLTQLLDGVIGPFLTRIGQEWEGGTLSVAQERVASSAIESALRPIVTVGGPSVGPLALAIVPEGEQHHLGALFAAAAAREQGVPVLWAPGPLPAVDVAALARERHAKTVLASIVSSSPAAAGVRVDELRAALPRTARLVVGGRATEGVDLPPGVRRATKLADIGALLHR